MAKLRLWLWIILLFLSFSSSNGRNLSSSFRVMFKKRIEVLNHELENEDGNRRQHRPQRSSPGGPDPQHH